MGCGRIRKEIYPNKLNWLVNGELSDLKTGVIELQANEKITINTEVFEYGFVLIKGEIAITSSDENYSLGPRVDPCNDLPYALLVTKDEEVTISAKINSIIGVGAAPAEKKFHNILITPDDVGGGSRGKGNWNRKVNFVIWSDNSVGNMLNMGETIIPSGNWATFPPHRHEKYSENEVPYEEAYYFKFHKPSGAGVCWQFDDDKEMDNAYSIRNNDVIYMDRGYHPVACAPGCNMYQLTIMSGKYRMSKSRVHQDYLYLLEDNNMENPYANQYIKK